jgi:hypothetical protein
LTAGAISTPETSHILRKFSYGEKQFLVVLNLGPTPTRFTPPGPLRPGQIVLSTHPGRAGEPLDDSLRLDGNEAVIVERSGKYSPGPKVGQAFQPDLDTSSGWNA